MRYSTLILEIYEAGPTIEKILVSVQAGTAGPFAGETELLQHLQQLRAWRDCALLLFLADSGLRVFEVCGLRRGEVDYQEGQITSPARAGRRPRWTVQTACRCGQYWKGRARITFPLINYGPRSTDGWGRILKWTVTAA